ncbi:MAG: FHA domain-containing protein [Wenzhouxiangella sp.]|nr:MAG: FHA domain-containing protein [Wenzhouxiangella sp.]
MLRGTTLSNRSKCTFVGNELAQLEARLGKRYTGSAVSSIRFLLQDSADLRCWFVNLVNTSIELGRSRSCDLVLVDSTVSGRHALLLRDGEHIRLRDLSSTNGCFVNKSRVADQVLHDRDEVRLGGVALKVFIDTLPECKQESRDATQTLVQFDVDKFTRVVSPQGSLAGPHYHAQLKACRKAIDEGCGYIVLDLSDVWAVSNNALRAFASLRRALLDGGGELILCSLGSGVRDSLIESGMLGEFDDVIFPDSTAARAFIIRCMTSPGKFER